MLHFPAALLSGEASKRPTPTSFWLNMPYIFPSQFAYLIDISVSQYTSVRFTVYICPFHSIHLSETEYKARRIYEHDKA